MKHLLIAFLCLISLGCNQVENQKKTRDFQQLTDDYLQVLWEISPESASWAGLNQYDSILTIKTKAYFEETKTAQKGLLKLLEDYPIILIGIKSKIDCFEEIGNE